MWLTLWEFCRCAGTSAGVELPVLGQGVGLMAQICWHLYSLGISIQSEWQKAILWVLCHETSGCLVGSLSCLGHWGKQSTPAPPVLSCWDGPAASPQAVEAASACAQSCAENQRADLKFKCRRSFTCFSHCFHCPQTAVPCLWSGDAEGSHSPGATTPPGGRRKLIKTGLGVNII